MKEADILNRDFRYERKFIVPYLDRNELDVVLMDNSFLFKEIYYERQVNNIYFDDFEMGSYFDNVLGNCDRRKIRIRWYGDLKRVVDPVLELKIKRGLVGTKLSFPLKKFSFPLSREDIGRVFENSNLPDWLLEVLKSQRFALVNCYKRKYYESFCRKFRITIDSNLSYYDALNYIKLSPKKGIVDDFYILELKYDVCENGEDVSLQFPFRMTKSSKYVTGVNYFRGE